MNFTEYWRKLEEKKGNAVEGDAKLTFTADQFKKMQRQAHEMGRRHGLEQAKALKDKAPPKSENPLYDLLFKGYGGENPFGGGGFG